MQKKSYIAGILLGGIVFGLPYALGWNKKCLIAFLILFFPVSLVSAGLQLPIANLAGAALGYYGVKEYNEWQEAQSATY